MILIVIEDSKDFPKLIVEYFRWLLLCPMNQELKWKRNPYNMPSRLRNSVIDAEVEEIEV